VVVSVAANTVEALPPVVTDVKAPRFVVAGSLAVPTAVVLEAVGWLVVNKTVEVEATVVRDATADELMGAVTLT